MELTELTEQVLRFEAGDMDEDESISFFQKLIDSGMISVLQGSYGRIAHDLVKQGLCEYKRE
jgi:hypothetical protein